MSENIVSVNNLSVSFDYQENFLAKKQKMKHTSYTLTLISEIRNAAVVVPLKYSNSIFLSIFVHFSINQYLQT